MLKIKTVVDVEEEIKKQAEEIRAENEKKEMRNKFDSKAWFQVIKSDLDKMMNDESISEEYKLGKIRLVYEVMNGVLE